MMPEMPEGCEPKCVPSEVFAEPSEEQLKIRVDLYCYASGMRDFDE